MTDSPHTLSAVIGQRIRGERKARGFTLEQLAALSNVSRRMIFDVEKGNANPSINTLLRLSDALGVGLPLLVDGSRDFHTRQTQRGVNATLWRGAHGGRGVLISGITSPEVVELWDWQMCHGEIHKSEAHSVGTKEIVHVRRGCLTLGVGNEIFEVSKGGGISFDGDVEHFYQNEGVEEVDFSLTVYQPNHLFTERNGARHVRVE